MPAETAQSSALADLPGGASHLDHNSLSSSRSLALPLSLSPYLSLHISSLLSRALSRGRGDAGVDGGGGSLAEERKLRGGTILKKNVPPSKKNCETILGIMRVICESHFLIEI